jgi:fibronectin type 3 domain-containing protein
MSAKKIFTATLVILSMCALVTACGDDAVSPTDTAPMLPPQNMSAMATAFGKVVLRWDTNSQANLAGYNVYRNEVGITQVDKLTPNPILVTVYEDASVEVGKSYQYSVTSVSVSGSESNFATQTVTVTGPGGNGGKLRKND